MQILLPSLATFKQLISWSPTHLLLTPFNSGETDTVIIKEKQEVKEEPQGVSGGGS